MAKTKSCVTDQIIADQYIFIHRSKFWAHSGFDLVDNQKAPVRLKAAICSLWFPLTQADPHCWAAAGSPFASLCALLSPPVFSVHVHTKDP